MICCRRFFLLTLAVLAPAVLTACTSETDVEGTEMSEISNLLLTLSDVPEARSESLVQELFPTYFCADINRAEVSTQRFADGNFAIREFEAGGLIIESAVFELGVRANRAQLFDRGLVRGTGDCSRDRELVQRPGLDVTFSPVTSLPDEAVGYTMTVEGTGEPGTKPEAGGPRVQQRAYALVGSQVVIVGVRRDGLDPPDVQIADLLTAAIAKVEQARERAGQGQPA